MRNTGIAKIFLIMVLLMFAALTFSCGDDDDDSSSSGESEVVDDDINDDTEDDDDTVDDDTALPDDDTGDDDTTPAYADEFKVVEIVAETTAIEKLAVQACAGLYNRRLGGSVYTRENAKDTRWLDELDLEPSESVDVASFLETCAGDFGCVRYSYEDQQALIPNILTVGAVLGAVPLAEEMTPACADPVFDAIAEFEQSDTPYLATEYVYENYLDDTTGLAMTNPGYNTQDDTVWDPALENAPRTTVIDYIFSRKLFAVFLINGCIDNTDENELLTKIATENSWPRPIGVYGYNNSWMVFGGYLFEAQTRCLESRNMGAIPTETTNLSFFSTRRAPIVEPGEIEQNEPENMEYDPDKTYVAFVVGDGDNVSYMLDARSNWIRQRLEDCDQEENSCEPITWSISPHLPYLAPDVLEWYYETSKQTGKDYFMLPPSGHLYAYPASMGDETQDQFVAATQADALILDTGSTIHWEWATTWRQAERQFMPKYADAGVIKGVFPVNVPYMFPTFTGWGPTEFFRIIPGEDGGEVVLFKPREWRGIDDSGSGLTTPFYLSPENMADELAGYPSGAVAYVYMTSDGGLNLENSFMALVGMLPERVQLVSGDTAARLALEAYHGGIAGR